MASEILYSRIYTSATEPTNPANYDWWIKNLETEYEVFVYANGSWVTMIGGGNYITETNPDDHFINTIVSDTEPPEIKFGWIWVSELTKEMRLYLGEYILLLGW
jgi:hypothetical protein